MAVLHLPVCSARVGGRFDLSCFDSSLGGWCRHSSCSPCPRFWRPPSQGNELVSSHQHFSPAGPITKSVFLLASNGSGRQDGERSSSSSVLDFGFGFSSAEDEDGENLDGFDRPDSNSGLGDFDGGRKRNSAIARILERLREIPSVGRGWSTPDSPMPTPAAPSIERVRPDTRFPWEREDSRGEVQAAGKLTEAQVRLPSLAELTLPEAELKRLRRLGKLTRHRIKVGRAGVTDGIVESIHDQWRSSEVAKIECKGRPAHNMKRTHEILEEKTGGLLVWREGGVCSVYRGKDYVPPLLKALLDFCEQSTSSSVAESQERKAEIDGGP